MKPPAFQFYADDFLAGTITMSHAERGLYIQLLCLQWAQGCVTAQDVETLAGATPTARVLAKFQEAEGCLRNPRLEMERQKQAEYREKQANKGRASAQARLNRGSTAVQPSRQPEAQPEAQPKHQPEGNSPFPSPSPSILPEEPPTPAAAPPGERARVFCEGKGSKLRLPSTEQSRRVAAIMHRKETTPWQENEIAAYQKLGVIPAEDLAALERYYAKHWPPNRETNILRHDLLTLLNNFQGEVGRAKAGEEKTKASRRLEWSPEPTPYTPPPLTPEELAEAEKFQARMKERIA